jgi:hypothetical protein
MAEAERAPVENLEAVKELKPDGKLEDSSQKLRNGHQAGDDALRVFNFVFVSAVVCNLIILIIPLSYPWERGGGGREIK